MCNRVSALLVLLACVSAACAAWETGNSYTNSIGMKMVRIEPGSFLMGQEGKEDECDWDEQPVHKVTISKPFYVSETEVTLEQFRQFRPDFGGSDQHSPYVAGVSWYDARAFCVWLSNKERRPYRPPTEAEWEYACRAGTQTPFYSGQSRPAQETANPWGLKNMHTGVREWCLDWHGEYPAANRVDPVGPAYGMTRVVRGGGMDNDEDHYARSANRASIAPSFAPYPEPKKAKKEPKVEDISQTRPGLIGMWYGESDFTNPKDPELLTQFENIEGHGNEWSVRWHGFIEAPFEMDIVGEVTFEAEADDDNVKLVIDGKTILDSSNKPSGKTLMVKGRKYPVVLSYSHSGGLTVLRLYWSWAGQSRTLVPGTALSHSLADEKELKPREDEDRGPGYHSIGFRIVQCPMPMNRPFPYEAPFVQQCVKQDVTQVKKRPNPDKPYFRKRYLLPTPPENVSREIIDAAGLHPSFREHNHSPALEVCPNGDVLMIIYTSYDEYEPGVSLMATRLRFGADQWDMPSWMFDFVDLNDHAPMLWNDNGVIYLFWGSPKFGTGSAYPFQWTKSIDNGATWSQVKFPNFKGKIGCHSKQPINTALRDLERTIYVSSDGCGGKSVLWASRDNGKTWYDTGGRSAGRHTTCVLLKDGSILGMGGKNTDIDGYMPKVISHDGGSTWGQASKTPFASLGSNQRPSVMRLQSGRLFFASDFQDPGGDSPDSITERGSFAALSDDEGKTWHIKKLIGTAKHENKRRLGGADTIGYSAARQAPNGLIHLITTMNRPCLHLVFNEAWVLAKDTRYEDMSDAELMKPAANKISRVEKYQQKYRNGKIRTTWSGGVADNGRFLLDGKETWNYRNGQKQYEVTYKLGRKVGKETYWAADGTEKWSWEHRDDGTSVWTQWWSAGKKKAESTWRNFKCDGTATRWDRNGNIISQVKFADGLPLRR